MKLEKGEMTTRGLIEHIEKSHPRKVDKVVKGKTVKGNYFTPNDIAQYLLRGMIPYRYGGEKITSTIQNGVRIIKFKDK